ncbi:hypothetical protein CXY01_03920 [Cellulomonas xylanilytica]|uniref:Uncharacterized protein n=1 Tax=Cellulomonas xylanilytica TaxID=233583 RepID=A0A510UYY2_9CELL|nr:hypothetical protein CXY01_03920 [Cellulomonas xylanilytica]
MHNIGRRRPEWARRWPAELELLGFIQSKLERGEFLAEVAPTSITMSTTSAPAASPAPPAARRDADAPSEKEWTSEVRRKPMRIRSESYGAGNQPVWGVLDTYAEPVGAAVVPGGGDGVHPDPPRARS